MGVFGRAVQIHINLAEVVTRKLRVVDWRVELIIPESALSTRRRLHDSKHEREARAARPSDCLSSHIDGTCTRR